MTTTPADPTLVRAAMTLAQREWVRYLRQRSRVLSGLATPLVFWLFLGLGMNRSFRPPGAANGAGYLAYFFPGSVLMVVLFTAIFSTISTIEDRVAGFLQAVLVAPIPRSAIVLGKVLGGTGLATAQGILFLLLAPLMGATLGVGGWIEALAALALVSFALTALGFIFAWRMDSVAGFHGVMNLLLMPMWLLSGALFPAGGASPWLAWLVRINPLSYGLAALRGALGQPAADMPGALVCFGVMAAFAALMYAIAARTAARNGQ